MIRTKERFIVIWLLTVELGLTGCGAWKSWKSGAEVKPKSLISASASGLLDTKPDTRQAQIDLAVAAAEQCEARRDYPEAMKRYQEVLVLDQKSGLAHHRMALLATRMSASQQAKEHFEIALRLNPKDDMLLADYAYWHYLNGNNQEAVRLTQDGLARSPGFQRFHSIHGLVLARERQFESAVTSFIASGCNQQEAWANVGHVLLLDGDVQSAEYWIGHAAHGGAGSEVARRTQKVIQASYAQEGP